MLNIDTLIESISQQISAPESQNTTHFSTFDLKYVHSRLNLGSNTSNHCVFNIISGDMTGITDFKLDSFYGLTDMPAEFQKAMDYTLMGLKKTYLFLGDILIVSKGSEEQYKHYVINCLKWLDAENLSINLPKCLFSKLEIDWLGCHISQLGISPIERRPQLIWLEASKTLKKIRSFLGSVRHISEFIRKLAQTSPSLQLLLKMSSNLSGLMYMKDASLK